MLRTELAKCLAAPEYDFLRDDPHLGKNIILLGLGGSYAYGVEKPDGSSDVDVRGIALNSPDEILLGSDFEEVLGKETDTTVYSFNKVIRLLAACNPSMIELLGLRDDSYLYLDEIGKELIANRDMFLSKKAADTFGGYAQAQLRRLDNKSARQIGQAGQEKHVLESVENVVRSFPGRYAYLPEDSLKLYVDVSERPDMDTEIFMDVNLHHYPLRDYKGMWSEMNTVVKDYAKIGRRNREAAAHGKIAKHMAHLVRLYVTGFDILEKGEIISYREKEHDLLMDIRSGKYLDENDQPVPAFYEMADRLAERLAYDAEHSCLPEEPDWERIRAFQKRINRKIVEREE